MYILPGDEGSILQALDNIFTSDMYAHQRFKNRQEQASCEWHHLEQYALNAGLGPYIQPGDMHLTSPRREVLVQQARDGALCAPGPLRPSLRRSRGYRLIVASNKAASAKRQALTEAQVPSDVTGSGTPLSLCNGVGTETYRPNAQNGVPQRRRRSLRVAVDVDEGV